MDKYFIIESKRPVSTRVYRLNNAGNLHYWHSEKETWYFLNTAHRRGVLESEVVFETHVFEDIKNAMKKLVESESVGLLLLSEEHSNEKLHFHVKKMWKRDLRTLEDCFDHSNLINDTEAVVKRQIALERYIDELINVRRSNE